MEKWKITFKTERSWSNDDFEIAAEATDSKFEVCIGEEFTEVLVCDLHSMGTIMANYPGKFEECVRVA